MAERYASVGHDIHVGGFASCDAHGDEHDRIIHIFHPYQKGQWLCRRRETVGPDTLTICYADGDSFDQSSCGIAAIAAFCRPPGRLLVHCAWGSYRSPTVALIAKIARGCDPCEAIRDVVSGLWRGYRQAPHLHDRPLAEILEWAEVAAR